MKQNLIPYSMQIAMLKQLLTRKLITEKEYYMVQNKLMKKYGTISDSTGLIVFLLAIHFVWELSYFQSFDFLMLEDLRMFKLNFNNIIGLDSRAMRIFLTKEYMTKHLS
ncbi:SHOCT domain-containing protein, partial [Oceanobacillus sp. MO10714A]|uniref:SHOCT domain-containing protein n=1 Tax=Oceanobacillus sp. MO10714A TaxID=3098290 RepID=UPI003FA5FA95